MLASKILMGRLQSNFYQKEHFYFLQILNISSTINSNVRLSFYTYYISPIEIGLIWAVITYHIRAIKGRSQLVATP